MGFRYHLKLALTLLIHWSACFISDAERCKDNPCKNQNLCVDLPDGFKCFCEGAFTGPTCDKPIACRTGQSLDKDNICRCEKRKNGDYCEIDVRDCYKPKQGDLKEEKSGMDALECLHYCQEQMKKYALSFDGDKCSCKDYVSFRNSKECTMTCQKNPNMICGGKGAATVMFAVSSYTHLCYYNYAQSPGMRMKVDGPQKRFTALQKCLPKGMMTTYAALSKTAMYCGDFYDVYDELMWYNCSDACKDDQEEKCGQGPDIASMIPAYRVDSCYSDPCKNIGYCRDSPAGFLCSCTPDIYCQIDVIGCYADNKHDRAMAQQFYTALSALECINYCQAMGYSFAGAEGGFICFCDESYDRYGTSTDCDSHCGRDMMLTCGGEESITVMFALYVVGCFEHIDADYEAGFPEQALTDMTQGTCANRCRFLGYRFASLQRVIYGDIDMVRCYCRRSIDMKSNVSDSNCNLQCPGKLPTGRKQQCGGSKGGKSYETVVIATHAVTNCVPNPCLNGGKCTNVPPLFYKCTCLPGFMGTDCETATALTACQRERKAALDWSAEHPSADDVPFVPVCDDHDGHYGPVQCNAKTHYCWCVDKTGQYVQGTLTPLSKSMPACK